MSSVFSGNWEQRLFLLMSLQASLLCSGCAIRFSDERFGSETVLGVSRARLGRSEEALGITRRSIETVGLALNCGSSYGIAFGYDRSQCAYVLPSKTSATQLLSQTRIVPLFGGWAVSVLRLLPSHASSQVCWVNWVSRDRAGLWFDENGLGFGALSAQITNVGFGTNYLRVSFERKSCLSPNVFAVSFERTPSIYYENYEK